MTVDWFVSELGAPVADMSPGRLDLRAYRGDSFSLDLNFSDVDGAPMAMTGTWRAQIRSAPEDSSEVGTFAVDDAQQGLGVITISLTIEQTTALPQRTYWDLENTPSAGEARTYLVGSLFIGGDISR